MIAGYLPVSPQAVDAPLTSHAAFLVLTINKSWPNPTSSLSTVRSTLPDLAKNVSIRDLSAQFACTVSIGANIWSSLTTRPLPKKLHPFPEVKGKTHTAVSTPSDLLFHICAERRDLCFEFERQLMGLPGDAVELVDETVAFRYFDVRDLLGFVDRNANPMDSALPESTLITAEDDRAAEGESYVVVQKYVHDLKAWRSLKTEALETIIGRTKFDNVELDDEGDDVRKAHKQLATVEEDGEEFDILRDNMPFGSPGKGDFGTYYIGYTKRLWVLERMLQGMFVGVPEGMHDRMLDYSRAVTGSTFFAPSAGFLDSLDGGLKPPPSCRQ